MMRPFAHHPITLSDVVRPIAMQAKSLLLGTLAGVSLTVLSLTVGSSVATAKTPSAPVLQQGYDSTQIISDRDDLFIVRGGMVYKVNKLQMVVMGRAILR
jgi:hypothetical protein